MGDGHVVVDVMMIITKTLVGEECGGGWDWGLEWGKVNAVLTLESYLFSRCPRGVKSNFFVQRKQKLELSRFQF